MVPEALNTRNYAAVGKGLETRCTAALTLADNLRAPATILATAHDAEGSVVTRHDYALVGKRVKACERRGRELRHGILRGNLLPNVHLLPAPAAVFLTGEYKKALVTSGDDAIVGEHLKVQDVG